MYLNPYDNVFETLFTMWLNTFWPGNLTLFQIEYALINGTRPHFLNGSKTHFGPIYLHLFK